MQIAISYWVSAFVHLVLVVLAVSICRPSTKDATVHLAITSGRPVELSVEAAISVEQHQREVDVEVSVEPKPEPVEVSPPRELPLQIVERAPRRTLSSELLDLPPTSDFRPRLAPQRPRPETKPEAAPKRLPRQTSDDDPLESTLASAAALNQTDTGLKDVELPEELPGNRPPVYPNSAYVARQEGRVVCRLWITALGTVERAEIDVSSGVAALDAAALEAARRWRFRPAMRGGVAVPHEEVKGFNFYFPR